MQKHTGMLKARGYAHPAYAAYLTNDIVPWAGEDATWDNNSRYNSNMVQDMV